MQHLIRETRRWERRLRLPPIEFAKPNRWISSYCRTTKSGYEIHICPQDCSRATLLHELGHVVFIEFYGTIIAKREFKRLFGDPEDSYYGLWWFIPWSLAGKLYEDDPSLPSKYASVHPEECWAETFSLALRSQRIFFGNRLLNARVAFARRTIKAILLGSLFFIYQ